MLDAREQLSLSHTRIAPQLIGHDHPRFILQTLQQPFEEALRRLGIAPGLNKDVEHNSMLFDGPPEIMLDALDTDEDLIHVPLVAGSWPTPAQSVGKTRCKFGTSAAPSRRRRGHRVPAPKISSTSRKLRLKMWDSQTAQPWPLPAANRWR